MISRAVDGADLPRHGWGTFLSLCFNLPQEYIPSTVQMNALQREVKYLGKEVCLRLQGELISTSCIPLEQVR